jgi:hypothetical protein
MVFIQNSSLFLIINPNNDTITDSFDEIRNLTLQKCFDNIKNNLSIEILNDIIKTRIIFSSITILFCIMCIICYICALLRNNFIRSNKNTPQDDNEDFRSSENIKILDDISKGNDTKRTPLILLKENIEIRSLEFEQEIDKKLINFKFPNKEGENDDSFEHFKNTNLDIDINSNLIFKDIIDKQKIIKGKIYK